ncbi:MAG: hypothetical protein AB7V46_24315 [Thermomicrobiales bacterium]
MSPSESWNQHKPPKPPPIPADTVTAIMERARAQLGRPCHLWPSMEFLQRSHPDGSVQIGAIGEVESGQAYQVWWHRSLEEGRLWPYVMLPGGGVQPRRFDP